MLVLGSRDAQLPPPTFAAILVVIVVVVVFVLRRVVTITLVVRVLAGQAIEHALMSLSTFGAPVRLFELATVDVETEELTPSVVSRSISRKKFKGRKRLTPRSSGIEHLSRLSAAPTPSLSVKSESVCFLSWSVLMRSFEPLCQSFRFTSAAEAARERDALRQSL